MSLPRLDWKKTNRISLDQQILVRMSPGKITETMGAPLVSILVSHPDTDKRIKGTGNSLMQAVMDVHTGLWNAGVRLHGPHWPEVAGANPSREAEIIQ
jgi:hypothetical protein